MVTLALPDLHTETPVPTDLHMAVPEHRGLTTGPLELDTRMINEPLKHFLQMVLQEMFRREEIAPQGRKTLSRLSLLLF